MASLAELPTSPALDTGTGAKAMGMTPKGTAEQRQLQLASSPISEETRLKLLLAFSHPAVCPMDQPVEAQTPAQHVQQSLEEHLHLAQVLTPVAAVPGPYSFWVAGSPGAATACACCSPEVGFGPVLHMQHSPLSPEVLYQQLQQQQEALQQRQWALQQQALQEQQVIQERHAEQHLQLQWREQQLMQEQALQQQELLRQQMLQKQALDQQHLLEQQQLQLQLHADAPPSLLRQGCSAGGSACIPAVLPPRAPLLGSALAAGALPVAGAGPAVAAAPQAGSASVPVPLLGCSLPAGALSGMTSMVQGPPRQPVRVVHLGVRRSISSGEVYGPLPAAGPGASTPSAPRVYLRTAVGAGGGPYAAAAVAPQAVGALGRSPSFTGGVRLGGGSGAATPLVPGTPVVAPRFVPHGTPVLGHRGVALAAGCGAFGGSFVAAALPAASAPLVAVGAVGAAQAFPPLPPRPLSFYGQSPVHTEPSQGRYCTPSGALGWQPSSFATPGLFVLPPQQARPVQIACREVRV